MSWLEFNGKSSAGQKTLLIISSVALCCVAAWLWIEALPAPENSSLFKAGSFLGGGFVCFLAARHLFLKAFAFNSSDT